MKTRHLFLLAILGLLAMLLSLYTTSSGMGLGPDSYIYLSTARSLLQGAGPRLPQGAGWVYTAHFPPGYAGMLAVGSLGLFDPLEAARWLNALLFGASLFLAGLAILKLSGGSGLAAGLGGLAFLGADGLLLIHAQVWSEAPFFCLSILGLLLLSLYLRSHRTGQLAGAAAAFGLAGLVRYAGVTLILAGTLSLLLAFIPLRQIPRRPLRAAWLELKPLFRARRRPLLLFLGISCAPAGLWLLANLWFAGSLTNRTLSNHPLSLRNLEQGLRTAAGWLFPGAAPGSLLEILALGVILAGLWLLIRESLRGQFPPHFAPETASLAGVQAVPAPAAPFALFILSYLAFLGVSLSFFDDQTGLDLRILSPVYITGLILAAAGLARWLPRIPRSASWPVMLLLVAFLGAQILAGFRMAQALYAGQEKGYNDPYWLQSRLLKQVAGMPESIPIYSNGYDVIYLLTGKPAIPLPREISPNSLKPNPHFEAEMQAVRLALEEQQGVVVIFYRLEERRRYLPSIYELNELLPLRRISRWKNEGEWYRIRK